MKYTMPLLGLLCLACSSISVSDTSKSNKDNHQKTSLNDSSLVIPDSLWVGINFTPSGNYNSVKSNIQSLRDSLHQELLQANTDTLKNEILRETQQIFSDYLVNQIIPHWYGTTWDYNGHTAVPNEGEIACGYFVSTTLRDMGLNLNRYRMAQQSALSEAKTLTTRNEMSIYSISSEKSYNLMMHELRTEFKDGFYLLGLDNHVGYFFKKGEHLCFIHSNYIDLKVMFEFVENSAAFQSNIYVFAPITNNLPLMKKWLENTPIKVVMD